MSQLAKTETAIKSAKKSGREGERGDDEAEGINKTQEADRDRDGDERRVWD